MELRVLKYFLAVARHQNITRAAEELHMEDFVAGDVYLGCGDVQRGVYHYEDKEILASFAFDVRSGNGAGCRRSGNGC